MIKLKLIRRIYFQTSITMLAKTFKNTMKKDYLIKIQSRIWRKQRRSSSKRYAKIRNKLWVKSGKKSETLLKEHVNKSLFAGGKVDGLLYLECYECSSHLRMILGILFFPNINYPTILNRHWRLYSAINCNPYIFLIRFNWKG